MVDGGTMATQPGEAELKRSADHAQQAAEHTEEAAERTAVAAEVTKDSADRRTELAADRTVFAAERTYAAWVRTGLGALASGIGAKSLLAGVVPEWMIVATGTLLVIFSGFCFAAAVWRQVFAGAPPPMPDVRRIPPLLLVGMNGFLVLVALAALLSIWFGRTGG
jgi:putative membrane protein